MKKGNKTKLIDIYVKPLIECKKVPGVLEIHSNSHRYKNKHLQDQKIYILFENIEHFFNPCNDEMILVIHCFIKNYLIFKIIKKINLFSLF